MGFLIGLPMKLFHILFVVLRFAWPLLLIGLLLWIRRRRMGVNVSGAKTETRRREKEPEFDGPVYTVDYEEVEDDETP